MFIQSVLTTKKHGFPTFSYVYPTKTPPFIVDFARCFTHFLVGPVPWGPLGSPEILWLEDSSIDWAPHRSRDGERHELGLSGVFS